METYVYTNVGKHYRTMRQILTIIMILALSAKTFACECPEYNLKELDKVSYEWSDWFNPLLIGQF